MYKSQIEQHLEDDIVKAIQNYEIQADKDERIKAPNYDRNQYQKGYNDAVANLQKTGKWIRWHEKIEKVGCVEFIPHCKCSECNTEYNPHSSQFIKYCSICGAKMEEEKCE